MATRLSSLRVLLIQAREEADILRGELDCFAERSRLHHEQFVSRNVLYDPMEEKLLKEVDALMIAGAGAFSAHEDYDWMPSLLKLCQKAVARRLPTFGSCWGHQVLARALGGTVAYDPERAELGCFPVNLTDAGRQDPLFGSFPPCFKANMGHHDRVTKPPPGAVELAVSDSQPFQAFRLDGLPVYGTQFHSELDADRELERLIAYRDYYTREIGSDEEFQQIVSGLADTSEVDHLLYDFLRCFAA